MTESVRSYRVNIRGIINKRVSIRNDKHKGNHISVRIIIRV